MKDIKSIKKLLRYLRGPKRRTRQSVEKRLYLRWRSRENNQAGMATSGGRRMILEHKKKTRKKIIQVWGNSLTMLSRLGVIPLWVLQRSGADRLWSLRWYAVVNGLMGIRCVVWEGAQLIAAGEWRLSREPGARCDSHHAHTNTDREKENKHKGGGWKSTATTETYYKMISRNTHVKAMI